MINDSFSFIFFRFGVTLFSEQRILLKINRTFINHLFELYIQEESPYPE